MPGNREKRCREIGRGDAGKLGQGRPGYREKRCREIGRGDAGIWGQGRPGYGGRRCRDMGAGKATISVNSQCILFALYHQIAHILTITCFV